MYRDKKHGRVLLRDGTSLVSSFEYARMILEDKATDLLNVAKDHHSDRYDYLNQRSIGVEAADITPAVTHNKHSDDDLMFLWDIILSSPRYIENEQFENRLTTEIEFFDRTNNILFVISCYILIQEFKRDGVVWGVGRGSSCASLVFYVLGINDINPLTYNIKFAELSKEM
ncbi:hypothetical protein [Alishewanella phage vB_AspM_Slicko01]|nr:hypothetical protein [Alishewanella phage vB_AspM_Slicko01]